MTAILNCYGIASESNFTEGFRGRSPIPFGLDIIAGNEWNDTLRQQFEKLTLVVDIRTKTCE